jgi:hypothetical protein
MNLGPLLGNGCEQKFACPRPNGSYSATSVFAEIVRDSLHYSPDSCFVALGKRKCDRPSCFTDSQGIPTVVRFSDIQWTTGSAFGEIGVDVNRLLLDCDGVEVMPHDLIGGVIRIAVRRRTT